MSELHGASLTQSPTSRLRNVAGLPNTKEQTQRVRQNEETKGYVPNTTNKQTSKKRHNFRMKP